MSTSLRGTFAAAASSASSISSVTLPTGIQDGDIGVLVCAINSSTNTVGTPPAGWTLVDGPIINSGVITSYLYQRTMAAADSGTIVDIVWSGGGRWNIGGAIIAGASGRDSLVLGTDSSLDTELVVPSYTPTVDDAYALLLVNAQHPSGQVPGLTTPPAGWTKYQDAATGQTGAHTSCVVLGQQLAGGAGVLLGGGTGAWAATTRNNQWVVTIAPTVVVAPGGAHNLTRWDGATETPMVLTRWDGATETPMRLDLAP